MSFTGSAVLPSWYHPGINRSQAEAMLRDNGADDGLFLVRDSTSNEGDYVLSFCHNGNITHYQIRRIQGSRATYFTFDTNRSNAKTPRFLSLPSVIRHIFEFPAHLPKPLKRWIVASAPRTPSATSDTIEVRKDTSESSAKDVSNASEAIRIPDTNSEPAGYKDVPSAADASPYESLQDKRTPSTSSTMAMTLSNFVRDALAAQPGVVRKLSDKQRSQSEEKVASILKDKRHIVKPDSEASDPDDSDDPDYEVLDGLADDIVYEAVKRQPDVLEKAPLAKVVTTSGFGARPRDVNTGQFVNIPPGSLLQPLALQASPYDHGVMVIVCRAKLADEAPPTEESKRNSWRPRPQVTVTIPVSSDMLVVTDTESLNSEENSMLELETIRDQYASTSALAQRREKIDAPKPPSTAAMKQVTDGSDGPVPPKRVGRRSSGSSSPDDENDYEEPVVASSQQQRRRFSFSTLLRSGTLSLRAPKSRDLATLMKDADSPGEVSLANQVAKLGGFSLVQRTGSAQIFFRDIIRQGFLSKLPPARNKFQAWRKRWFKLVVTLQQNIACPVSLEYYTGQRSNAPKGVIGLNDVIKVKIPNFSEPAVARRFRGVNKDRVFEIVLSHRTYPILASSKKEKESWMKTLQNLLGMGEDDVYDNIPTAEKAFEGLILNKHFDQCRAALQIHDEGISLVCPQSSNVICTWRHRDLRSMGFLNNVFWLEAGTRSETGEGVLCFLCPGANQIYTNIGAIQERILADAKKQPLKESDPLYDDALSLTNRRVRFSRQHNLSWTSMQSQDDDYDDYAQPMPIYAQPNKQAKSNSDDAQRAQAAGGSDEQQAANAQSNSKANEPVVVAGVTIPGDELEPVAVAVPRLAYQPSEKRKDHLSFGVGETMTVLACRRFVPQGFWLAKRPRIDEFGLVPMSAVQVHEHDFGNYRDLDDDDNISQDSLLIDIDHDDFEFRHSDDADVEEDFGPRLGHSDKREPTAPDTPSEASKQAEDQREPASASTDVGAPGAQMQPDNDSKQDRGKEEEKEQKQEKEQSEEKGEEEEEEEETFGFESVDEKQSLAEDDNQDSDDADDEDDYEEAEEFAPRRLDLNDASKETGYVNGFVGLDAAASKTTGYVNGYVQ